MNRIGSVIARKPGKRIWRSFANCSFDRIGFSIIIWWQLSGPGASKFRSGPMVVPVAVTISSRIASIGGLVTWANICLK